MGTDVLVTGGSGFIGSFVVENLEARGLRVRILDVTPPAGFPFSGEYVEGDVTREDDVRAASAGCSAIIHLAGVLGTSTTLTRALETSRVNVLGTLHVLEAACPGTRVVLIDIGNRWENPYSITKEAASRLGFMYYREFGLPVVVVRATNAYGPRQKFDHTQKIIPTFICRALTGEDLPVFGSGQQQVDLVHVTDVAEVIARATLHECAPGCCFDAGTGRTLTVNKVARLTVSLTGSRSRIVHLAPRPGEPPRSKTVADLRLASRVLGYVPQVPFEEGLMSTIAWYRTHLRDILAQAHATTGVAAMPRISAVLKKVAPS